MATIKKSEEDDEDEDEPIENDSLNLSPSSALEYQAFLESEEQKKVEAEAEAQNAKAEADRLNALQYQAFLIYQKKEEEKKTRANKARLYIPPPYVPSGPGNLKTPESSRYLRFQGTINLDHRLQFPSDNPHFLQTPKGNHDYGEGGPSNIRALSDRTPGESNSSDQRKEYSSLSKPFVAPTHTINSATEQLRLKAAEKVFLKDLKVESIQAWLLALRDFEMLDAS